AVEGIAAVGADAQGGTAVAVAGMIPQAEALEPWVKAGLAVAQRAVGGAVVLGVARGRRVARRAQTRARRPALGPAKGRRDTPRPQPRGEHDPAESAATPNQRSHRRVPVKEVDPGYETRRVVVDRFFGTAATFDVHRVAGGGPLPTGGRYPGRAVSTG